ncbi:MAG TPA: IS110 family transposase [Bryobacteraceae bacterium]|jgi:transposase|nr:IS110 family transposase [Bryobacteraceae bacterium]
MCTHCRDTKPIRRTARIAELLQHGLLKGSFIPPRPIRELRDVTRRRTHLQSDRNRVLNRIRRLLETANFKLGSVVSDINGRTAHLILDELAHGHCDPKELAQLAKASLKDKKVELAASLHGFYSEHFRWLLSEAVQELADLDRKLEQVDKRLAKQLQPHVDLLLRLCTIPGVDFTTAAVIVAEIGLDMSRFPDAAHLASWAGLSPGNNESAGKRYSGSTCKGNRYLRRILTQSAWSLLGKKDCYLTALFRRVSVKGGRKKAALAVAHRMLTIAWHIIQDGTLYEELGGNHYDRLHPDRSARRLIKRLEQIGFQVTVQSNAGIGADVRSCRPGAERTRTQYPPVWKKQVANNRYTISTRSKETGRSSFVPALRTLGYPLHSRAQREVLA